MNMKTNMNLNTNTDAQTQMHAPTTTQIQKQTPVQINKSQNDNHGSLIPKSKYLTARNEPDLTSSNMQQTPAFLSTPA